MFIHVLTFFLYMFVYLFGICLCFHIFSIFSYISYIRCLGSTAGVMLACFAWNLQDMPPIRAPYPTNPFNRIVTICQSCQTGCGPGLAPPTQQGDCWGQALAGPWRSWAGNRMGSFSRWIGRNQFQEHNHTFENGFSKITAKITANIRNY